MTLTSESNLESASILSYEASERVAEMRIVLRRLVAETHQQLLASDTTGMDRFVTELNVVRLCVAVADWRGLVLEEVSPHPILQLIHEEPFTRRAFQKPRGYAGDAPLLDLIYRDTPWCGELTALGAKLHTWTSTQPACRSVQVRRDLLARLIDDVAQQHPNPRVLSIACGHLREAQRSHAVQNDAVEEFVALDQDAESLAVIAKEQHGRRITLVKGSIRRLMARPTAFGTFDLAYSAGLFDYLEDSTAHALIRSMFAALRPGGLLLVANFAPELRDIGYMEAVMDWKLIYRAEETMARLITVCSAAIAEQSLFRDEPGNVVYLTMRKT